MPELIKKCPECGSINLFWNREKGEVICKDCGLVIEDKMVDFGQEWREFDSDTAQTKRRTGAPMTYTQSLQITSPFSRFQQKLQELQALQETKEQVFISTSTNIKKSKKERKSSLFTLTAL